jgi:hypothetical protein
MTIADLTRIDSRSIPMNRGEIRAFMVVWNDALRLQSLLQHYRQLGVARFFIADCGSQDGTLEILATAPDVHVFADADGGMDTLHTLLDTYSSGHWAVIVDADELLIYPHHEKLELPLFCRYLDHVGAQAMACTSVDMYAASPIGDAVHRRGAPLLDTCPYFDAGPYRMAQTTVCPHFEVHGGVRERLFGQSAVLTRVPLVRWQSGTRYLRGTANITPVKTTNLLGALLRFDLMSDFLERSPNAAALANGASTNVYGDTSVRFESSMQLVALGLMATSKPYEESVQLTAAARLAKTA